MKFFSSSDCGGTRSYFWAFGILYSGHIFLLCNNGLYPDFLKIYSNKTEGNDLDLIVFFSATDFDALTDILCIYL